MYGSVYGSFVAMADVYGMTAKYDLTVHSPSGTKVGAEGYNAGMHYHTYTGLPVYRYDLGDNVSFGKLGQS